MDWSGGCAEAGCCCALAEATRNRHAMLKITVAFFMALDAPQSKSQCFSHTPSRGFAPAAVVRTCAFSGFAQECIKMLAPMLLEVLCVFKISWPSLSIFTRVTM